MTDEEYLLMITNGRGNYLPTADFLRNAYAEQVLFDPGTFGDANLEMLIRYTRDPDVSNRDWAMLLLDHTNRDSAAIRAAFVAGLNDPVHIVRLEALCGPSRRDPECALPVVMEVLGNNQIDSLALEAAANVAHPNLLPMLHGIEEGWTGEDDDMTSNLSRAIKHCSSGEPFDSL